PLRRLRRRVHRHIGGSSSITMRRLSGLIWCAVNSASIRSSLVTPLSAVRTGVGYTCFQASSTMSILALPTLYVERTTSRTAQSRSKCSKRLVVHHRYSHTRRCLLQPRGSCRNGSVLTELIKFEQ